MSAAPDRPARKQIVAPAAFQGPARVPPTPQTVNIWTGKPLIKGARGPGGAQEPQPAQHRCSIERDAGTTRADGDAFFCLYFARGCCQLGAGCAHLHRLPGEADEARLAADPAHDVFGRPRYGFGRDARGAYGSGAGSVTRDCRTLYVNYSGAASLPGPELRQLLLSNFGEWGPVDDVSVVRDKAVAFVRYRWRASAEFGKEAMARQSLRGSSCGERLVTRWASDDPNPRAQARVAREREESLRTAVSRAVQELPRDAKRARLQQLGLATSAHPRAPTGGYPDTDAQFAVTQYGPRPVKSWKADCPNWYDAALQEAAAAGGSDGGGEQPAATGSDEHAAASGQCGWPQQYRQYAGGQGWWWAQQQAGGGQYDAAAAAAAWDAYYRQQAAAGGGGVQAQQAANEAGDGAAEGLGLIAGYGSGSDSGSGSEGEGGGEGSGGGGGGDDPAAAANANTQHQAAE